MKILSATMGIDNISIVKVLNFLPYPLLLSELRNGEQRNIFVNKNFIDEIGYTCEDIPTINSWFKVAYPDPDYRNLVLSDWNDLIMQANSRNEDFAIRQARIKTKFKGEKWFEVKASLFGARNIVAFINIDAEIRREEKLQWLNENKDRTLSILSHDLRAPLVSLYSVLPLLANNSLSESEQKKVFTKLSRQVFEMMEFLDTTLQWARTNFSDQKAALQLVDLQAILGRILKVYHTFIEEKRLKVNLNASLENWPAGDPEIFSIITRNLISNAIKYTPIEGQIKVISRQENDTCIIEVENSGVAISRETIGSILSKTYSSKPGTMSEKGLGVGLRLCLQLLERVNGKMEIETPSVTRTVFRILFPLHTK